MPTKKKPQNKSVTSQAVAALASVTKTAKHLLHLDEPAKKKAAPKKKAPAKKSPVKKAVAKVKAATKKPAKKKSGK